MVSIDQLLALVLHGYRRRVLRLTGEVTAGIPPCFSPLLLPSSPVGGGPVPPIQWHPRPWAKTGGSMWSERSRKMMTREFRRGYASRGSWPVGTAWICRCRLHQSGVGSPGFGGRYRTLLDSFQGPYVKVVRCLGKWGRFSLPLPRPALTPICNGY